MNLWGLTPDLFGPLEEGTLVVDAVLIVGDRLPPVFISRTTAPDEPFRVGGTAVTNARVVITANGETFGYRPDGANGAYVPLSGHLDEVVQPETTYSLIVSVGRDEEVRAVTRTQPQFEVGQWVILDEQDFQLVTHS